MGLNMHTVGKYTVTREKLFSWVFNTHKYAPVKNPINQA